MAGGGRGIGGRGGGAIVTAAATVAISPLYFFAAMLLVSATAYARGVRDGKEARDHANANANRR